jgi:hypothetical protein
MQTFVPIADLAMSAQVLDSKRLNKQLLEGRQIYGILSSGKTKGAWVNHPAVRMWKCYDNGLYEYLKAVKEECVMRGIQTEKNWTAIEEMHEWNWNRGDNLVMPPWWGDNRVHESHRYNLHAKDPVHYAQFAGARKIPCCDRCNYWWPGHTLFYNNEFLGYVEV